MGWQRKIYFICAKKNWISWDPVSAKLLFDYSSEAHGHAKILGGDMVSTHAGDMIGEVALEIEMGADAIDIGKTIHPHPTLGGRIGMAAEVVHGSCTDVPPSKK